MKQTIPPEFTVINPVEACISRLSPSSQLTIIKRLRRIVSLLGSTLPPERFPWHTLRYPQTLALHRRLVQMYSPAAARVMIFVLRSVLRECIRLGLGADETERALDLPYVPGGRIRPRPLIKRSTMNRLLRAPDGSPAGVRAAAILQLLYVGGLRRAEVIRLDLKDAKSTHMMVLGKRMKWREVALNKEAKIALRKWLKIRGTRPGPLFVPLSRWGTLVMRRLCGQTIADITRQYGKRVRLFKLSPHSLRRARSTHLLESGRVSASAVQKMLGHQNPLDHYDLRSDKVLIAALRKLGGYLNLNQARRFMKV